MIEREFLVYLVGTLAARWFCLPEARAARPAALGVLAVAQAGLCLVFFAPTLAWTLWATVNLVLPILLPGVAERVIRRGREAAGERLLLLAAQAAAAWWYADQAVAVEWVRGWAASVSAAGLATVAGGLLCLKEGNFFVRWFFARIKPRAASEEPNQEERARAQSSNGRVIGALERLLLYVLLLGGQTVAVPVIVAVKALARFKRMEEDQAFAEYVIIGTFLSLLLTLAVVGAVRWATGG